MIFQANGLKFLAVLKNKIIQYSSEKYQSNWDKVYTDPAKGFFLDSKTEWKTLNGEKEVTFSGRLIGGCVCTLQVIVGTPFDSVEEVVGKHCQEESFGTFKLSEWIRRRFTEYYGK